MNALSLNGGGMVGYFTAVYLARLEKETNKKTHELFDIVSGVSTGSIIASGVANGMPATEIAELYKKLGKDIFGSKCWLPWKPWYSGDKLYSLLKTNINFQFNKSKIKTMIYSTKINSPGPIKPKFWKSWKENDDVFTSDIITASCSAPVYFKPFVYKEDVYIDGGIVSNNPTICTVAELLKDGVALNTIKSINISCGRQNGFDKANKIDSIIDWITKLPTLAIRTGEQTVEYQANQLLGTNALTIVPSIDLPLETLDFSSMENEVNKIWNDTAPNIISLLNKE